MILDDLLMMQEQFPEVNLEKLNELMDDSPNEKNNKGLISKIGGVLPKFGNKKQPKEEISRGEKIKIFKDSLSKTEEALSNSFRSSSIAAELHQKYYEAIDIYMNVAKEALENNDIDCKDNILNIDVIDSLQRKINSFELSKIVISQNIKELEMANPATVKLRQDVRDILHTFIPLLKSSSIVGNVLSTQNMALGVGDIVNEYANKEIKSNADNLKENVKRIENTDWKNKLRATVNDISSEMENREKVKKRIKNILPAQGKERYEE